MKKPRIPPAEYRKLSEQAEALLAKNELFVSYSQKELIEYGIYFLPPDHDVRFVSEANMHLFVPFITNTIKLLKVLNYDQPAIGLRFTLKHKYSTIRNVPKERVRRLLEQLIEELKPVAGASPEIIENNLCKQEELERYLRHQDNYTFTLSSYLKDYHYYQASIRYQDSNAAIMSQNHHIAKTRANIIFVSDELYKGHKTHSNKIIEKELGSMLRVAQLQSLDLFARPLE
jgi:hypothetical protein